jgi:hypothetical protein
MTSTHAVRSFALLSLLVFSAACASSTDVIDSEVLACGPGQALEIQAGVEGARGGRTIESTEDLVFLVEVANNSHEDVVIEAIRIEPDRASRMGANVEPVYKVVNEEILQGKDHLFRFPAMRKMMSAVTADSSRSSRQSAGQPPEMMVTVLVKNGDSYRCSFSLVQ